MSNNKKNSFISWTFVISFLLGSVLRDIVEGLIGFKRSSYGSGFNGWNFTEDILIFLICYIIVNYLVQLIKKKLAK